jgi:hypothetical protein
MKHIFRRSRVDGYWICECTGEAILPSPEAVTEHINGFEE